MHPSSRKDVLATKPPPAFEGPSVPQLCSDVAQREDDASFDEIFRRYAPMVSRLALKVLGRPQDVEDVVQDVFLSLHRAQESDRIVNAAAVRGWLATTVVRIATTKLRKRRLRTILSLDVGGMYDDMAGNDASAEERALLGEIYRTLDKVSAAERVAWALRFVEGETLERVAELCECSLSTAKRRIYAAHDIVRQRFDGGPAAGVLNAFEQRVAQSEGD